MVGAMAGGIACAVTVGEMSKMFECSQKSSSGRIQSEVLANDNNTEGKGETERTQAHKSSNLNTPTNSNNTLRTSPQPNTDHTKQHTR